MIQRIRNVAIFAHVDAGKTSLTEQILLLGGRIKKAGSVDEGTTHTDFLKVEKDRGISVRSAHTSVVWKDTRINLADTPGHVDFTADVERVLRVIDGAVLVVSAVEGVQAHTVTLWNALRKRRVPVLLFVNKIDRVGTDIGAIVEEMRREWKVDPLPMHELEGEGSPRVQLRRLWAAKHQSKMITEAVVAEDEPLLERYLEGEAPAFEVLDRRLGDMIRDRALFPMLFGSAKLSLGIGDLLDSIVDYLPAPSGSSDAPLSALVFGMDYDKTMGKVAHVRIFDGGIGNREIVPNATRHTEDKVVQIRRLAGGRHEETPMATAGEIVGVCGLASAAIGDVLGCADREFPSAVPMQMPLLTVQVKAADEKESGALGAALQQLNGEDPSLRFEWLRDEGEMNISVMGSIQMEVLERVLLDRFGVEAKFENPTVSYRETPAACAEGFIRYWMPKPCWAILKFRIEPGERGSGVVYESLVGTDEIARKYQNEVESAIPTALEQGLKGWEVTDIRITLIDGEDHEVHSHPGDFVVATPMGILNGLVNSGTVLLEPMVSFRIRAAEELLGPITSDITKMRGSFDGPEVEGGKFVLRGVLPVATSQDYPVKLSSRSGGNATIMTRFSGYRPCPDELGVVRSTKGVSPLDQPKWILKARGALR